MNRIKTIAQTIGDFTYPRDLGLLLGIFSHRVTFHCPPGLWEKIAQINGYMRPKEAGLLYWSAKEWPAQGPVIELGSFEGRSTILFASAGRHVHAIDAWAPNLRDLSAYAPLAASTDDVYLRFLRNLQNAQVEPQVIVHRGHTQQVAQDWNTMGAILYIDAGHTYEDVKNDLATWSPFLAHPGLLLMHDVVSHEFPGVKRAVSEALKDDWRTVASADSLVAFCRR